MAEPEIKMRLKLNPELPHIGKFLIDKYFYLSTKYQYCIYVNFGTFNKQSERRIN
jgi:hypothetical protein